MKPNLFHSRRLLAAVVAIPLALLLSALAAAAIVLHSPDLLRGLIDRQVSASLGRPFRIGGALRIAWRGGIALTADDITLANAPWGQASSLAQVRRIDLLIKPWPLLHKELTIARIALDAPTIHLERAADGRNNWTFASQASAWQIHLGRLKAQSGQLTLTAPGGTRLALAFATLPGDSGGAMAIHGSGSYLTQPFALDGRIGDLLSLGNVRQPYPVELTGHVGTTRAHISGDLLDPLRLAGLDLRLDLQDTDMARLYPLLGLALPHTRPYRLTGQLRHAPRLWTLSQFHGQVGGSDLGGSLSFDLHGKPFLRGEVHSGHLQLADLRGFIGNPAPAPRPVSGRTGRILPNDPIDLGKLRAMDADVRFDIQDVRVHSVPVHDVSGRLYVHGAQLDLQAARVRLAGGRMLATLHLDGRRPTLGAFVNARLDDVDLHQLLRMAPRGRETRGLFSGHVYLSMQGNTVAALLARANGKMMLAMRDGQISSVLVKLAGIDLSGVLPYLVKGDRPQPIDCAVADGRVVNGLLTVQQLAVATRDSDIKGRGQINFADESVHLALLSQPRGFSLLRPRVPIEVGGHLAHPVASVSRMKIGLRLGLAAAAGLAAGPLGALLVTSEWGSHAAPDCPALLDQAHAFMRGVPAAPLRGPPAAQRQSTLTPLP